MSQRRLLARLPSLPGAEFFGNAENSILTADGSALLSFDPVTSSGFVYYIESGQWSIQAPINFSAFALYAHGQGLSVRESEDALRWVRACSGTPSDGTRH